MSKQEAAGQQDGAAKQDE
jgi:Ras-related protein Rab-1A